MPRRRTSRGLLPEARDGGAAKHLALSPMSSISGAPIAVLRLCSGRRREEYVQFFLDHLTNGDDDGRGGRGSVVMVSVDVAIDPVRGNLASVETLRFWADMVADRRVAGLIGGPLLETWSTARGIGDGALPGPPVLRSAEEPWELHGPNKKHSNQLRSATLLVQRFLVLVAVLVARGGFTFLRHTAEPGKTGPLLNLEAARGTYLARKSCHAEAAISAGAARPECAQAHGPVAPEAPEAPNTGSKVPGARRQQLQAQRHADYGQTPGRLVGHGQAQGVPPSDERGHCVGQRRHDQRQSCCAACTGAALGRHSRKQHACRLR